MAPGEFVGKVSQIVDKTHRITTQISTFTNFVSPYYSRIRSLVLQHAADIGVSVTMALFIQGVNTRSSEAGCFAISSKS